jgi:DNA repair protein RAD50
LDSIKALRKDRVGELKTDKERLQSLLLEKGHADKLKGRIADLNATIAAKEVESEEIKKEYERLMAANQKFYEQATKFREIFTKVESLQNQKVRLQSDLEEARENMAEVEGVE